MHEMSLVEEVLRIIDETAGCEGFRRVRKVSLRIGQLAAVEPEAMRFCFDAATRGGIAEGALLEIAGVPGLGWCGHCAVAVPMAEFAAICPHCGRSGLRPTDGMQLQVASLEVE
jgi:hydrogenase nickel incorporation protein HypA/HybF